MLTNVVPDVSMSKNLIEVRNLVKHFEVSNGFFFSKKNIEKAFDGKSFNIKLGNSLESQSHFMKFLFFLSCLETPYML